MAKTNTTCLRKIRSRMIALLQLFALLYNFPSYLSKISTYNKFNPIFAVRENRSPVPKANPRSDLVLIIFPDNRLFFGKTMTILTARLPNRQGRAALGFKVKEPTPIRKLWIPCYIKIFTLKTINFLGNH